MSNSKGLNGSSEFSVAANATTTPARTKARRKTPPPFSLRLTADERARLERDAGTMAIGAYIRSRIFDAGTIRRLTGQKRPVKDHQVLAQVLGKLGNAHLANNLNQLAKAANCGALPVSPETEEALRQACDEVRAMRQMLMRALGLLS